MIQEIIKHFGNQAKLAKKLGIGRAAVNHWSIRGIIPPNRAIQIEKLTEGKFKAIDIV